jgi:hypothetical protein
MRMKLSKIAASLMLTAAMLTGSVAGSVIMEAPKAEASFKAPSYKQFDKRWANEKMGGGATLKDKGCAVTSVAMALAHKGITVDKQTADPKNLNNWLKNHKGYSGNSIVWGSVTGLSSKISFVGRYYNRSDLSAAKLREYLDNGSYAILANVNNGGHWVLLTDHNKGTTFYVNDPGSSTKSSYTYNDFVGYAVYKFK